MKLMKNLLVVPEILLFGIAAIGGGVFGLCMIAGLKCHEWRTGRHASNIAPGW